MVRLIELHNCSTAREVELTEGEAMRYIRTKEDLDEALGDLGKGDGVPYRSEAGRTLIATRAKKLAETMPGYTEDELRALAVDQLERVDSIRTTGDASGPSVSLAEAQQAEREFGAEERRAKTEQDEVKVEARKLMKKNDKLSYQEALRAAKNRRALREGRAKV